MCCQWSNLFRIKHTQQFNKVGTRRIRFNLLWPQLNNIINRKYNLGLKLSNRNFNYGFIRQAKYLDL